VGDKELREYLEVTGYGDAARGYTGKHSPPVNGALVNSCPSPRCDTCMR
jgi:hypothetical protein